jgi:hypothetical protein
MFNKMPHIRSLPGVLFRVGLAAFLLCACSRGPSSPMKVSASISPAPVVGQVVTLHIEIESTDGRAMPNTTLAITLPSGVEAVSGGLTWAGDIAQDEKASMDVSIQVTAEGEWAIYVYAFSHAAPGSEYGFGDSKTLYVRSSPGSAEVVEDINRTPTRVPVLSGGSETLPPGSLVPITPSPDDNNSRSLTPTLPMSETSTPLIP